MTGKGSFLLQYLVYIIGSLNEIVADLVKGLFVIIIETKRENPQIKFNVFFKEKASVRNLLCLYCIYMFYAKMLVNI